MPANPPNNRLPDQSRRRLRLPLLLLAGLLFNALAISSLTLYALRGQRAEIDRTREAARDRSLALLSSQVEQALLAADLVCIGVHVASRIQQEPEPLFLLSSPRGLPELFQHIKEALIAGLLLSPGRRHHVSLMMIWALLFT